RRPDPAGGDLAGIGGAAAHGLPVRGVDARVFAAVGPQVVAAAAAGIEGQVDVVAPGGAIAVGARRVAQDDGAAAAVEGAGHHDVVDARGVEHLVLDAQRDVAAAAALRRQVDRVVQAQRVAGT